MSGLTAVQSRPILFSAPMVRAILEGRKTKTRRVIRFRDFPHDPKAHRPCLTGAGHWQDGDDYLHCPYGAPGGRQWVRETWAASLDTDGDMTEPLYYRATYDEEVYGPLRPAFSDRATEIWDTVGNTGWRPSIHMPRAYSRITLEVTGVRVERVQDISHRDALAEGVAYDVSKPDGAPVPCFAALWDSINAARGYGWASNPWVWVVEFRRVKP